MLTSSSNRTLRVLFVDDDPVLRRLLPQLLSHYGHSCDLAQGVTEGLQRLTDQPYDLVISDVEMPGRSGLELAAKIRQLRPGLPIILTSGSSDPSLVFRAREVAAGYLQKPFTHEALRDEMTNLLPASF